MHELRLASSILLRRGNQRYSGAAPPVEDERGLLGGSHHQKSVARLQVREFAVDRMLRSRGMPAGSRY
jgi:hypothetical protein